MPLPIGAAVVVRTFGNKRGVVSAVRRDGRYQVRIEGITLSCSDEDLAVPAKPRKKKPAGEKHRAAAAEIGPPGRVDLHGLLVEEALARVASEIDRSLLRGADRVEVVHGKGSGRIRDALHRYLASMPVVAAFRLDPWNPGVTWVLF